MTRLKFLLGFVGGSAAAQTAFRDSINREEDVTRVTLGDQPQSWTVTHGKSPANGQCPVCGMMNEAIYPDPDIHAGQRVATYCAWCSVMFTQHVEQAQ